MATVVTILRRLLQTVPTLFGVSILVFFFLAKTGDPVRQILGPEAGREEIAKLRRELNLDRNVVDRYRLWLWDTVRGDFGESYSTRRPVAQEVLRRFPATLELAATTMFVATLVAMVIAVLSVRKPGGAFDATARAVIFVFLAMPSFWLGIELIIVFSRKLPLFPPAERGAGSLRSHVAHLVLPALTLGIGTGASLCRVLRASLLEVLNSDFVRTARAKGLGLNAVLVRHALRNALIPFVTLSGISVAALMEGSIIIETVFAWPGIGSMMIEAIKSRDAPVAMAGVLLAAVTYVTVNLVVDILYVVIDPRVRLGGRAGK